MKKRVVGAVVLVILGIALPLMLARCMQDGSDEQASMRVYEVAPDGQARPASEQGETQQAQNIDGSSGVRDDRDSAPESSEETPELPEAVSPSSEPESRPAAPEPENTPEPASAATAAAAADNADTDRSLRQRESLSGYVVQVASFGDEANAERLARELNDEFKAFYRSGDVNGKTYYRVRVGPFENEESANAAAAQLRRDGRATLVRRAE